MFLNHIYQLIKQRIEAQVPQIKEFGWYMGQGTSAYKGGLVAAPACFLEYIQIDMDSNAKREQMGTVNFKLILISESLNDSPNRTIETINFSHLATVGNVFMFMHGYSPFLSELPEYAHLKDTPQDYQVFTPPNRTTIRTDHSNRSILITEQIFSCKAKDFSAVTNYTKLPVALQIQSLEPNV